MLIIYNQENYIIKTVESVLIQETNFDIELTKGDDNPNNSSKIIAVGLLAYLFKIEQYRSIQRIINEFNPYII